MEHLRYPNESTEYRAARNALLNDEIALRAQIETVAAKRRALPPGGKVSEDYVFERIGKNATPEKVKMSELFGSHNTLILYGFMYGPERELPCPGCTHLLDGIDGAARHMGKREMVPAAFVYPRGEGSGGTICTRETAWMESMYWECIFLSRLYEAPVTSSLFRAPTDSVFGILAGPLGQKEGFLDDLNKRAKEIRDWIAKLEAKLRPDRAFCDANPNNDLCRLVPPDLSSIGNTIGDILKPPF